MRRRSTHVYNLATPTPAPPHKGEGNKKKVKTVHAPQVPLQSRRAMYSDNKLQIGLFGANCSSGRAVTHGAGALVGQLAGQQAAGADGGRGRHRLPAADRPLEGLWRRHRLSGHDAGDHHLGHRAPRLHQAHHGVRHRARADLQSGGGGEGNGHRRPHRRGPLRAQHRGRLERRRVRHVRRRAARARATATTTPRNGSTSSR